MRHTRFVGQAPVSLNTDHILDFFENRARRSDNANPLTTTMYQDASPELAVARDNDEKNKIVPLLHITRDDHILDIGCGTGRWCEPAVQNGARYLGVDFSPSLIALAQAQYQTQTRCEFKTLPADRLSFAATGASDLFTCAIISGLLIYLNDQQVQATLSGLLSCMAPQSRIYLREPLGLEQRLTLCDHWSDELQSHYSATYRTAEEIDQFLADSLLEKGFRITRFEPLYSAALNNRKETAQYFYLLER